ncbi:MAG: hypothetical protein LBN39_10645 [Planctomycetaceae bacterium]|nr:hypothetical protein [Planctomycetaceae bacterium]
MKKLFLLFLSLLVIVSTVPVIAQNTSPAGTIHIPIGSINALDALKTSVEDNGSFSPGLMSFGVYPGIQQIANMIVYYRTT